MLIMQLSDVNSRDKSVIRMKTEWKDWVNGVGGVGIKAILRVERG